MQSYQENQLELNSTSDRSQRGLLANASSLYDDTVHCRNNWFDCSFWTSEVSPQLEEEDAPPEGKLSFLANELNQMSMNERDRALHDIHGVSDEIQETPTLISSSLEEMELHLDNMTAKHAYDLAYSISPEYVMRRSFRLKFLRAESFHPKLATDRMVRFFDAKLDLFGPEKLCKDITMEDLHTQDVQSLESGYLQLLPGCDRSGRAVICSCRALVTKMPVETRLRNFLYLVECAVEDDEIQRKGIVLMLYAIGQQRQAWDRSFGMKVAALSRVLPARFVAIHLCCDKLSLRPILEGGRRLVGRFANIRMRIHFGTHVECQYLLLTFGIPKSIFPFDPDGNYPLENHREWMKSRMHLEAERVSMIQSVLKTTVQAEETKVSDDDRKQGASIQSVLKTTVQAEESKVSNDDSKQAASIQSVLTTTVQAEESKVLNDDSKQAAIDLNVAKNVAASKSLSELQPLRHPIAILPRQSDVLFGRGKVIQAHPGNLRYRHLIFSYMEQYEHASKLKKTAIAEAVVSMVKKSAGRFLKQGHVGWILVDDATARDKVSHAFRNRRNASYPSRANVATSKSAKSNEKRIRKEPPAAAICEGKREEGPQKGMNARETDKSVWLGSSRVGTADQSSFECGEIDGAMKRLRK